MSEDRRGKRGPKGDRERFQLVIPKGVLAEVRALAESENRSISNMLATLVAEAIKTRKERERKEPGQMRRTVLVAARL